MHRHEFQLRKIHRHDYLMHKYEAPSSLRFIDRKSWDILLVLGHGIRLLNGMSLIEVAKRTHRMAKADR